MRTLASVVDELRDLFRAGATPSRLIRHVVTRHATEPHIDSLVRAYFREAFHVPLLRVHDVRTTNGLNLAHLNVNTLHQLVQSRREWDDSLPASDDEQDGSWLSTLQATDESEMTRSVDPMTIPELAGAWDRMSLEAQEYVRRLMGNCNTLHEKATIAAALAEQLQHEVQTLESTRSNREHRVDAA